MAQYESNVKHVPYSQERVYDKLSDLNNLAAIRERMDEMREKIGDKIQDMTFDRDSLTPVSYTHLTLPTTSRV